MADSLCMPGRSDKEFEEERILDYLHMLLGVWEGEDGIRLYWPWGGSKMMDPLCMSGFLGLHLL